MLALVLILLALALSCAAAALPTAKRQGSDFPYAGPQQILQQISTDFKTIIKYPPLPPGYPSVPNLASLAALSMRRTALDPTNVDIVMGYSADIGDWTAVCSRNTP
ncbi:hypothetical protein OH76DRAFT_1423790 [Lentinus brumalis]|uniref:Uncharacterized protein n=1 Tax=Lentinus brumalis TaxID=2498619 RepID=A0A371CJ30_9APHY|nr:hypothetical protein OH76DRAFT_1423790 [Polyporus brumalis]